MLTLNKEMIDGVIKYHRKHGMDTNFHTQPEENVGVSIRNTPDGWWLIINYVGSKLLRVEGLRHHSFNIQLNLNACGNHLELVDCKNKHMSVSTTVTDTLSVIDCKFDALECDNTIEIDIVDSHLNKVVIDGAGVSPERQTSFRMVNGTERTDNLKVSNVRSVDLVAPKHKGVWEFYNIGDFTCDGFLEMDVLKGIFTPAYVQRKNLKRMIHRQNGPKSFCREG